MKPIKFPEANSVLLAGAIPNCVDLPIQRADGHIISCWKLDEKDIEEILKNKVVWLGVLSETTSPPVFIAAQYPLLEINVGDTLRVKGGTYLDVEVKENYYFTQMRTVEVPDSMNVKILMLNEAKTELAVIALIGTMTANEFTIIPTTPFLISIKDIKEKVS